MTSTTTAALDLTKYLADHGADTLRGLRVIGTTSGGTEYTGTVGDRMLNLYVRVDVDGGGWVRSDSTLTLADPQDAFVVNGPNGVTATLEGDGTLWLVTATETDADPDDNVLARWTLDDIDGAFGLLDNVAGSDLSDF